MVSPQLQSAQLAAVSLLSVSQVRSPQQPVKGPQSLAQSALLIPSHSEVGSLLPPVPSPSAPSQAPSPQQPASSAAQSDGQKPHTSWLPSNSSFSPKSQMASPHEQSSPQVDSAGSPVPALGSLAEVSPPSPSPGRAPP